MEFEAKIDYTLFGSRYYYKATKLVKGLPGFYPEYFSCSVCDIVTSFKDNDEAYIQFSDDMPSVITIEDLQEIINVCNKGFIKDDFKELETDD